MAKVLKIERTGRMERMYDISLQGSCKAFSANGVIVHNSGQELRIPANMAMEEVWIDAFNSGRDIHSAVCEEVFGEVTKDLRDATKPINFGILYGMSHFSYAARMGITVEEAKDFFNRYRAKHVKLFAWIARIQQAASRSGKAYTAFGRPRRLHHYFSSTDPKVRAFAKRSAVNTTVQGCLQGHVRILTSEGYIPIRELHENCHAGNLVWTGKRWAKFRVLNRGLARLASLYCEDGHRLDCDTRHEVRCHTMRRGSIFKSVMDLIRYRRVCANTPGPVEFGLKVWPRSVEERSARRPHNYFDFLLEESFQVEFAYWLGRHIGDGGMSRKDWVICFGRHEEDKARSFERFLNKLNLKVRFSFDTNEIGGKIIRVGATSTDLVNYFKEVLGYKLSTAKTKRIPEILWKSSLELRRSFIEGLYQADGYRAGRSIHLMNHELLREMQLLVEVSSSIKTRLRGPFSSCGSSTLQLATKKVGCARLDPDYSFSSVKELRWDSREEETYTLEVYDEDHQFVSEGLISKNSAADVFRIALVNFTTKIYKQRPNECKFRMAVHDEIDSVVRKDVAVEVLEQMVALARLRRKDWPVLMDVGVDIGASWGDLVAFHKEDGVWCPVPK